MPEAGPGPALQKRIDILTQAVAQGKPLKPEHKAEYDKYVQMGWAKSTSGKPMDDQTLGDYHATMATIYRAMKQNEDWGTQGFTGWLSAHVPGFNTESKDYRANLQALQDKLSLQNLQKMREESPTGGALGNVTEGEERLLANATANLDPDVSAAQRRTNLRTVMNHFSHYMGSLGHVAPNAAAVDYLNAHPETAAQFDQKFGKGASGYYLEDK